MDHYGRLLDDSQHLQEAEEECFYAHVLLRVDECLFLLARDVELLGAASQ